ncbi:oxygenase MpaB family protein [Actinomadura hibisca]|uniref:oxygenase MpaB family protein n=1 Tax=Actinomadura hibisca TaxID=68565 RepID=UPI0008374602|nr:oxygenase MpaB family protein [Actinomadura hibisca]
MDTTASRLPFRPGDVSWTVTREPVLGLGAAPTLLLQVTHPLVAAGVDQHSDFERDPFARLWRTADIMLKLSFADAETSARQSRVLRAMHKRVEGVSDEGTPYRALDPDLLTWVWATLVHNALDLYQRTFGPLSDADRERFYQEQKLIAHACGVPEGHCPEGYAEFRAYFARVVREELRPTATSAKLLDMDRRLPLPAPLGSAYLHLNLLAAGALLPPDLRRTLGIPWNARRAAAFNALLRANRAGARVVPARVRHRPTDYLVARDKPLRLFSTRRARPGATRAA